MENFQIKPNLYSYSNKINNNTIGKINNNEYSSPTKLINQRKGPIDITYNTFEKNQNLKPLLETQKINQDKTDGIF